MQHDKSTGMSSEIYYESKIATIYHEGGDYIKIVWNGPCLDDEFKTVLLKGLELLEERSLTKWLGDNRNLGVISKSLQEWSIDEFFAKAKVIGLKKLVAIIPTSAISRMGVKNMWTNADIGDIEYIQVKSMEEALEALK